MQRGVAGSSPAFFTPRCTESQRVAKTRHSVGWTGTWCLALAWHRAGYATALITLASRSRMSLRLLSVAINGGATMMVSPVTRT